MYDEILVPTDGSDPAQTAVEHAVALAGVCDARVHGLFVTDSGTVDNIEGRYPRPADELEELGEGAVGQLEERAADAGIEAVTHVAGGTAHEAIVEYATDNGIDLIVMGTRGRQGVERYLLGSVTERVVRTADPAVLTVDETTPTAR